VWQIVALGRIDDVGLDDVQRQLAIVHAR